MKYSWQFNLVLCVMLTVASPQGLSAKHTVLDISGPDDVCYKFILQKATFSPVPITYAFAGTCDLRHTRLALPITVPYKAVGTYDPTNGKTTEDINVPPPAINEPSRPYGRFFTSMHCSSDPWRDPSVKCDQIVVSVNPPASAYPPHPNAAGDYARSLIASISQATYYEKRPYTGYMGEDVRGSLNARYQAYLAAERKKEAQLAKAKQPSGAYSALVHPSVLTPTANQILAPQRAVQIKLAPPNGWKVTTYTINIQRKDPNGNWVNHTSIPVGADQAHSLTGYTGFGGGAPPAFLMLPGRWRLNAQASLPNKSGSSDWIEFSAVASADFAAPKRKTPLPF